MPVLGHPAASFQEWLPDQVSAPQTTYPRVPFQAQTPKEIEAGESSVPGQPGTHSRTVLKAQRIEWQDSPVHNGVERASFLVIFSNSSHTQGSF